MASRSRKEQLPGNVKVWIRLKDEGESYDQNTDCGLQLGENGYEMVLKDPRARTSSQTQHYCFDRIILPECPQNLVYDKQVTKLVSSIFNGFNACIFAFGPTGSGKTYTMQGPGTKHADAGIIPRAIKQIFRKAKHCSTGDVEIQVSFLEIYNEKLNDLLCAQNTTAALEIRENNAGNISVTGLTSQSITVYEEFIALYEKGCSRRKRCSTLLNSKSSRSHCILTVKVVLTSGAGKSWGKLHLIDLAGNEDNRKTGNQGQAMIESGQINLSLFTLGKVIASLNDKSSKERVPYRDSKLTRLLKDSLGGNSQSLMICCITSNPEKISETSLALKFAGQVKNVRNAIIPNPSSTQRPPKRKSGVDMASKLEAWKRHKSVKDTAIQHGKKMSAHGKRPNGRSGSTAIQVQGPGSRPARKPSAGDDSQSGKDSIEQAKRCIEKATQLEKNNKLTEALRMFQIARNCLPNHSKLSKRIQNLESHIASEASKIQPDVEDVVSEKHFQTVHDGPGKENCSPKSQSPQSKPLWI